MESMYQMIRQLTSEVINLKTSNGKGKKLSKTFLNKETNTNTSPYIPPTLGNNLEDYAMDNFCRTHHANHSEKTCLEFINSFRAMLIPLEEDKNKEEEKEDEVVEEEEEERPQSHLKLIWDEGEADNEDDDVMEEACVENDYNLQSKGAPKSSDSTPTLKIAAKKEPSTTTSATKVTSTGKYFKNDKVNENHPIIRKNTISLDLRYNILGYLKLDYDMVEDLKKMKVNINVFELCKITKLREQLCEALKHIQGPKDVEMSNSKVTLKGKNIKATKSAKASSITSTSSVKNTQKINMDKKQPDPKMYGALIGRKSRSKAFPFLLIFDIFNQNIHNFLVDSRNSLNVMPYSVNKKLNAEPRMCKKNISQLDISHVKVLGELKYVLIHFDSNSKVHHTIDIILVDIPEAYGVIQRRDWLAKINKYFTIDWSHLWLAYKGQLNKIKVEHECYMKHMVTSLNDPNEAVMFSNSILKKICFDMFFGELEDEISPLADLDKQYELLHSNPIAKINCTLVDYSNDASIDYSHCTLVDSSFTNYCTQLTNRNYGLYALIILGIHMEQVMVAY